MANQALDIGKPPAVDALVVVAEGWPITADELERMTQRYPMAETIGERDYPRTPFHTPETVGFRGRGWIR